MIRLYLTVAREDQYKSWRSYEKNISWPCCPDKDSVIIVGKGEDGECSSINARVKMISFCSDGTVTVDATIEYCREEFESICESLVRDGFELKFTDE